MTKEEYKKNVIRMFDSLRNEYKGEDNCLGVDCKDCPLNKEICNIGLVSPYKVIEIVENWVKEHPVKTNSQKFEEVFGFKPLTNACVNGETKCKDCEYYGYDGFCDANRFWDAEYMPPKEGEDM